MSRLESQEEQLSLQRPGCPPPDPPGTVCLCHVASAGRSDSWGRLGSHIIRLLKKRVTLETPKPERCANTVFASWWMRVLNQNSSVSVICLKSHLDRDATMTFVFFSCNLAPEAINPNHRDTVFHDADLARKQIHRADTFTAQGRPVWVLFCFYFSKFFLLP